MKKKYSNDKSSYISSLLNILMPSKIKLSLERKKKHLYYSKYRKKFTLKMNSNKLFLYLKNKYYTFKVNLIIHAVNNVQRSCLLNLLT